MLLTKCLAVHAHAAFKAGESDAGLGFADFFNFYFHTSKGDIASAIEEAAA